ncbi:hypothetical protein CC1G_05566 [Coprinopsis cinerea okayama7|uniref:F-box domain-containing protein n=1 Tax=Coprinopsis cinerea (strain Okayama-7 / 130 / ATCC MYA-4618 / FGSC 9003) TaxID=240176 RepID=A8P1F5_COPC7|nr:hypothetical protein CC1G_05566 [Coprinopsis cinerea okayama7\|eukprot:XP_001838085.1 hypothetical protein CC1G_05566 [Coprinopsis cinerea okayama7\
MSNYKRNFDVLIDSQVNDGREQGSQLEHDENPPKRLRPTEDEGDASDESTLEVTTRASHSVRMCSSAPEMVMASSNSDNNISTLCPDILERILGYLVDEVVYSSPFGPLPDQHDGLMQLLAFSSVCATWRNTALNSAVVWAKVAGSYTVRPELMKLILERSKEAPLYISADVERIRFHAVLSTESEVQGLYAKEIANMRAIFAHSERLRELRLALSPVEDSANALNNLLSRRMDSLKYLYLSFPTHDTALVLNPTNLFDGSAAISLKELALHNVSLPSCYWKQNALATLDFLWHVPQVFDHDPTTNLAWMEPLKVLSSLRTVVTGFFLIDPDTTINEDYMDRVEEIEPVSLIGVETLEIHGNFLGVVAALALVEIPPSCTTIVRTTLLDIWRVEESIGERTFAQLDKLWPEGGCSIVTIEVLESYFGLTAVIEGKTASQLLILKNSLGAEQEEGVEQDLEGVEQDPEDVEQKWAAKISAILGGLSKGPRFRELFQPSTRGTATLRLAIDCDVNQFIEDAQHEDLRDFFKRMEGTYLQLCTPGAHEFVMNAGISIQQCIATAEIGSSPAN